jgi:hypothetical protein
MSITKQGLDIQTSTSTAFGLRVLGGGTNCWEMGKSRLIREHPLLRGNGAKNVKWCAYPGLDATRGRQPSRLLEVSVNLSGRATTLA